MLKNYNMKQIFILLLITSTCFAQTKYLSRAPVKMPISTDFILGFDGNTLGNISMRIVKMPFSYFQNSAGYKFYNIKSFGADTSFANNSTYIQAAIDSAHSAGGGTVIIDIGTYRTTRINMYDDVHLSGYGMRVSILKSITSDTLIRWRNYNYRDRRTQIDNIQLNGNHVGKIGLDMLNVVMFDIRQIYVINFEVAGFNMRGCLIGSMYNVYSAWNKVGAYIMSNTGESGSQYYSAANLITCVNCSFTGCDQWGIYYSRGASLNLIGCDLSYNAWTDTTGGGIYAYGNSWGNEVACINIIGGWCEGGGGITFKFGEQLGKARHKISMFVNVLERVGCKTMTIEGSVYENTVLIEGWDIPTLEANGQYAKVLLNSSYITSQTLTNGATVKSVQYQ